MSSSVVKTGAIPLALSKTHNSISAHLGLCYIKRFCFAGWEICITKKPFFINIHNCTVMFGVDTKLKSCYLLLPWPFFPPFQLQRWRQMAASKAFLTSGFFVTTPSLQLWCFFIINSLLETTLSYFEVKHLIFINDSRKSIGVYWPPAT